MTIVRMRRLKGFQGGFSPTHSVWKKASRSEVSMAVGCVICKGDGDGYLD